MNLEELKLQIESSSESLDDFHIPHCQTSPQAGAHRHMSASEGYRSSSLFHGKGWLCTATEWRHTATLSCYNENRMANLEKRRKTLQKPITNNQGTANSPKLTFRFTTKRLLRVLAWDMHNQSATASAHCICPYAHRTSRIACICHSQASRRA